MQEVSGSIPLGSTIFRPTALTSYTPPPMVENGAAKRLSSARGAGEGRRRDTVRYFTTKITYYSELERKTLLH